MQVRIRAWSAALGVAVVLCASASFADDTAGSDTFGVAPTGAIRMRAAPRPVAPAPVATPVVVPEGAYFLPDQHTEAPKTDDAPPAGAVDEMPVEPPVEGGPVIIEEVPPPVEVVPPSTALDGYSAPSTWPPAPTAPRRLVRRPRPSYSIHIEGALSLYDDPEGGLGEAVPAAATPYDWARNEFDPEIGGRLSLSFAPGTCYRFEVRGTYYGAWDASSTQTGSFGFSPPAGGFSPSATANFASEAEAFSFEGNMWWESKLNDCFCWRAGVGVRFVNLEEEASVSGFPIVGAAATGSLNGTTENQFFGGQIMLGGTYTPSAFNGKLDVDVGVKGLLGQLERTIEINDDSILSGGPHFSSREEEDFGFGAEARIGISYRISRCLQFTAAYELLYMADVSRAHSSFDFSQGATGAVQAGDNPEDVLIHSIFLGLRFDF